MPTLSLGGSGLTLQDAAAVLAGKVDRVEVPSAARQRIQRARKTLEQILASDRTVYGVNTGFGKLSNQRIAADELLELQENLIRSHAVGVGGALPVSVARLALALRIQALAKGFSGVTVELVQFLAEMFNRGVVPVIPEQGSVGASGDLAPLAHLALVVMGEGSAWLVSPANGEPAVSKPLPGRQALRKVGLAPYRLQPKEGLSLINGTQISCALLADAAVRARNLATVADIAVTMTLEATKSSLRPFDPRLHETRPHPGQAISAANVRHLMEGSEILPSHANCSKVQDAYSIRCSPQVHGTFRDGLAYVQAVVEREMNSATDNPLVFAETGEVLSGGNFHGQPLALAADLLAAAATNLAGISERRVENLVNPDLSGLPGFLTPKPGLNSGMMLVQVLAAALTSENKVLSHPAGVDSIPTSGNREDHVSMSTHAARKVRQVIQNTTRVLACELLCAAQGLEFLKPLRPGRGAEAAYRHLRRRIAPLDHDRTLHPDLIAVAEMIEDGSLLEAVRKVCPQLQ
ncbi:MAG: histidine ammonia-lyase [Gemmatales bacterium]|nr:histidine ammonia-lyase [Gemmatales bacterium]MDW8388011.1 histidine ammonia-lyase [Gemmatales bacterium]